MSEEFKSLREVAIAMRGVEKQAALNIAVFAGAVVIAVAVAGFFYNKLDKVSDSVARVETRMTSAETTQAEIKGILAEIRASAAKNDVSMAEMRASIAEMRANIAEIKIATKKASLDGSDMVVKAAAIPSPNAFEGYAGLKAMSASDAISKLGGVKGDFWIFSKDPSLLKTAPESPQ